MEDMEIDIQALSIAVCFVQFIPKLDDVYISLIYAPITLTAL